MLFKGFILISDKIFCFLICYKPQASIEQPPFAAGLSSEISGASKVTHNCVTESTESLAAEVNFRAPAPVASRSRNLKRLSCKLDVPEDHLNETISSPCISSATKCMENSNQVSHRRLLMLDNGQCNSLFGSFIVMLELISSWHQLS